MSYSGKKKDFCEKLASLNLKYSHIRGTTRQNTTEIMEVVKELEDLLKKYPKYIRDTSRQNITEIGKSRKELEDLLKKFPKYTRDNSRQNIKSRKKLEDKRKKFPNFTFPQRNTRRATIMDTSEAMNEKKKMKFYNWLQKELELKYKVNRHCYIKGQTGFECGYIAIATIFECFKNSAVNFWSDPVETVEFFNFIIGEKKPKARALYETEIKKIVKVLKYIIGIPKNIELLDMKSVHDWYIDYLKIVNMDNEKFIEKVPEVECDWFGGVCSIDEFFPNLERLSFARNTENIGFIVNTNNRDQSWMGHWFVVVFDNYDIQFPNQGRIYEFNNQRMIL